MKPTEFRTAHRRVAHAEDERASTIPFLFLLMAGLVILASYGAANVWYAVKEFLQ